MAEKAEKEAAKALEKKKNAEARALAKAEKIAAKALEREKKTCKEMMNKSRHGDRHSERYFETEDRKLT